MVHDDPPCRDVRLIAAAYTRAAFARDREFVFERNILPRLSTAASTLSTIRQL